MMREFHHAISVTCTQLVPFPFLMTDFGDIVGTIISVPPSSPVNWRIMKLIKNVFLKILVLEMYLFKTPQKQQQKISDVNMVKLKIETNLKKWSNNKATLFLVLFLTNHKMVSIVLFAWFTLDNPTSRKDTSYIE